MLTSRSTKKADELWKKGVRLAKLATKADADGKEELADHLMAKGQGYRSAAAKENVRAFGERGKY